MAGAPPPAVAKILSPVCSRLRFGAMLYQGAIGLRLGTALALGFSLVHLFLGGWLGMVLAILALVGIPLIFALRGWLTPCSLAEAARAVDARYGLQDRALTALATGKGEPTPVQTIQLRDAVQRMQVVKPAEAAPWPRLPYLATSLLTGLAAVGLLLLSIAGNRASVEFAAPTSSPAAVPAIANLAPGQTESSQQLRPYQADQLYRHDPALLDRRIVGDYFLPADITLLPGPTPKD
ncbi:DUF4175 domain-containing protein [Lignipirellula cremea]|uniref:Uncharacterized protein n=1 Tax=Lignipirellula cremea TaxID=2528010 RepID=A0A518DVL1_9BACT|nr:DUF4175 domain-containing protein [Lignipirellula cremea]QDU95869.1 hypothetical protein Pla8534_36880 [Lignipirellula cremea]